MASNHGGLFLVLIGLMASLQSGHACEDKRAESADNTDAILKKMLTLMEGETKRTIRMESRLKSLEFKTEVQARDMRELKRKTDRLAADNQQMRQGIDAILEQVQEGAA